MSDRIYKNQCVEKVKAIAGKTCSAIWGNWASNLSWISIQDLPSQFAVLAILNLSNVDTISFVCLDRFL